MTKKKCGNINLNILTICAFVVVICVLIGINIEQQNKIDDMDWKIQKLLWYNERGLQDYTIIPNEFMDVPIQQNITNLSEGLRIVSATETPLTQTWINGVKVENRFEELDELTKNWDCDYCDK